MSGLARYREVLTLPGALRPVAASVVASLPIGMFGLALVLLARETTGSFAEAGRVAGAFGIANAIGAVAQGRLMDRLGQTRVLRGAAVIHILAIVAVVLADASALGMALAAACAGLTLPQVPAAMRSLWGELTRTLEQRQTAYALVSIVFEVAIMSAPVLVWALSELSGPAAALLVAGALCAGGGLAFSLTSGSRSWRGAPRAVHWLGPLTAAGMRTVALALVFFGTGMGIVQVAVPAFAAERGPAAVGGILLAALSLGNLTGGIVYGARSWPGTPARRFVVLLALTGCAFALLAVAGSRVALFALLIPAGFALAPATVVASTLLDTVAPPGTATESFAVMVMGIVAGSALGNALGGWLVDGASYTVAALVAGACAGAGALAAWGRRRTLSGSD